MRLGVVAALLVALVGGVYVLWPRVGTYTVVGHFTSAAGLYPGDEVRIVGVPIGSIASISPEADSVKITMRIKDDVKLPADARAVIMAPNLVSARFIQFTPAYRQGPEITDGDSIGLDRTAVPVEWDDVKTELTRLSQQLGPSSGQVQGPLSEFVNQAADTFDGNGDSFRQALRELSQTAGRLGDSSGDLFGTVKNLQILVNALSSSNEQIVQFSGHLASVSQVLADSSAGLDDTLGSLNQALSDVRGFLDENNEVLIGSINRLTDFTSILTTQTDDVEQVLHVLPNAMANFYNIYNPAQGTANGLLGLPEFANPVQFICGNFDTAGTPDYDKRAEICRQRMAPVLKRLAMNYPPIMAHGINTITAYKGQVIYDTPATAAKAQTYIPYLEWIPAEGRFPPRAGNEGDPSALLLPENAVPGPPPPAQPYTLGPVILPPGPAPAGPPPGPAPGPPPPPGPLPAEAAVPGGGG
ncbi:phospholipid/cholesterol/gamma-HCH transport system substrate-binding protein [Mycolicibacterium rutilum]|uniref:Phospholipid/cholesterol/gamma-HCH transport system substrate-binding protein n=1 Tax=Mycolicibacterium rutilum TaxID=370526 RepID=A0A1H6JNX3_MYCRU|nr:MCE family protein [Mycolicibacterium rutilum]SEH62271.1 phospholipid/cholesterol/gamma-HCH transport system substrate-binding protein [Mycolicibacterium rutilum]